MCELFQSKMESLGNAGVPAEQIKVNNETFPTWLGTLLVGGYIALVAESVLKGSMSVGVFLATIRIFQELSDEFAEGYEELIKVTSSIGSLRKLTAYLNRRTDLS